MKHTIGLVQILRYLRSASNSVEAEILCARDPYDQFELKRILEDITAQNRAVCELIEHPNEWRILKLGEDSLQPGDEYRTSEGWNKHHPDNGPDIPPFVTYRRKIVPDITVLNEFARLNGIFPQEATK